MPDLAGLSAAFVDRQDDRRVRRMWRVIEARQEERQGGLRWSHALVGALCVLLAIGAFMVWPVPQLGSLTRSGTLTLDTGEPIPQMMEADQNVAQRFSDKSSLLATRGAELELLRNTGTAVAFALRSGRVRFDIEPGGPRAWQMICGPVTVDVLGTSFTVDCRPDRLDVDVSRGAVVVRGAPVVQGRRRVEAGSSLTVRFDIETVPPPPRLPPAALQPPTPQQPSDKMAGDRRRTLPHSWRQLAENGSYDEAYGTLGPQGVSQTARRSHSPDELFTLADVARLSGHPGEAVLPLGKIIAQYPTDSRAGLAAYTLGKLYLRQLSDPAAAVDLFEQAERLGLPRALEESAAANRVRALISSDDPRARAAAETFLQKYPNSRYAAQVGIRIKR